MRSRISRLVLAGLFVRLLVLSLIDVHVQAEIARQIRAAGGVPFDPGEAQAFLEDLGLEESAMSRVIRHCYGHLGLISVGHGAFICIGALAAAHAIDDLSVPFLLAPFAGAIVGLVAGLYPSWRASTLEPVDALRGGT